MKTTTVNRVAVVGLLTSFLLVVTACGTMKIDEKKEDFGLIPARFSNSPDSLNINSIKDTLSIASQNWRTYFKDEQLIALIDTALKNNQELHIVLQEMQIANNEVMAKKGEYTPSVNGVARAGAEKSSSYTPRGAQEEAVPILEGKANPKAIPDLMFGASASWEVDIWHKLRNAKKAAYHRFMATTAAKDFMITNLVAEIANSYYELLALDNQLAIVKQNIEIQNNALNVVRMEKEATRVTELAVRKFEAEVYHTSSLQFDIQQQIIETENRINFLVGRYPQPVKRANSSFENPDWDSISLGVPSQLMRNRPDIKAAELNLMAAKLDLKSARANFYPSFTIRAGIGFQAFNPVYLVKPEAILASMAGDLVAPLVNRAQIKTVYYNANAKQTQAVYNYEQRILNAYVEVANQVANIENLKQRYALKSKQVEALNASIDIANNLFVSARADYMEVLLTQRDALVSKFELIETQRDLFRARIGIYRALGGGWR